MKNKSKTIRNIDEAIDLTEAAMCVIKAENCADTNCCLTVLRELDSRLSEVWDALNEEREEAEE